MSNDNFSTDEVRRQLRVVDRANDAVMPRWREALERIMGGDEKLSTDEKAAILGVPNPQSPQLLPPRWGHDPRRRGSRGMRQ